ncbi:MAG: NINE protein [Clostridiales bacterium]|nr:NINE protein [Candidatus Apopatousia equi]
MHCPKCYGKIDKQSKRCVDCGFRLNEMKGATHKEVRQARRDGVGQDVLYTTDLPEDIKKKKLLLLCVFLGLFGAHSFYTGKIFKAIFSIISTVAITTIAILFIATQTTAEYYGMAMVWTYSVSLLLMGINIVMFLFDLINIIRNKYKVSVYKDEFSNY